MGKTSSEAKNAWKQRNYKGYLVNLRYDIDQDLIEYVEKHKDQAGVTGIFREALEAYLKKGVDNTGCVCYIESTPGNTGKQTRQRRCSMEDMNAAEIAVQEAKRAALLKAYIELQTCKTLEEALEKLRVMADSQ